MAFIEDTISSKLVYEGPVFKVRKHTVNAVRGKTAVRDVVEHGGGSVMVVLLDSGKILLEKQYRKAVGEEVIELPAGKRDPGENFIKAAERELQEETGYIAADIDYLTTIYTSVGYSSERLDIFFCTQLTPGERHLDPTEDIDIEEVCPDDAIEMVMNGRIKDGKTVTGLLYARAKGLI